MARYARLYQQHTVVAGRVGLLVRAAARISVLVLTAFLFLWEIVLQIPRAVAHSGIEVYWLGIDEDTTLLRAAG